jgi:hypothetical protein
MLTNIATRRQAGAPGRQAAQARRSQTQAQTQANQQAGVEEIQDNQQPIQPNLPVFSLTPGTAQEGIIDFNTKGGKSLYGYATEKLEEELYDCTPDGFYQFLQNIKTRAEEFGWSDPVNGVLMIPTNPDDPNSPKRNLLFEYGSISLESITKYELSYIQTETRKAQDDRMLYQCLINSLSKEGKAKVIIWRNQYVIGNNELKLPSGNCLLKIIIRESHLDTNATTTMIRTKLSSLDTYIHQVGNDITKFNGYVRVLLDTLKARGETTNDLLTNLFKGYGSCSDKNFVEYISRKQEEYDEGKDLSAEVLMELANTKFKQMKDKEIWEAPSPEEEKILALQARIDELKKKFTSRKRGNTDDSEGKRGPKRQHTKKFDRKGGKYNKEKPDWMTKRPAESELRKPRKWNGRDWHWCSKETGGKCDPPQYRCHLPSKCKGTMKKKTDEKKVVINETVQVMGGYQSE